MADIAGFDADAQKPMKEGTGKRELIPPGDYRVIITESVLQLTAKAQASQDTGGSIRDDGYLFTFQIVEGELQGTTYTRWFTRVHSSDIAKRIAREAMGNIGRAVGVPKPTCTTEWHNRPLMVTIGQRFSKKNKENEDFDRMYYAVGADSGVASSGAAPQTSGGGDPWD